jgi:hypothetical protein
MEQQGLGAFLLTESWGQVERRGAVFDSILMGE